MTVILRRKSEMSLAFRGISGFGHGPEQKSAYELLTGRPLDRILKPLDLFRSDRLLHPVRPKSLTADKFKDVLDLLRIRISVYAVDKGDLFPEEILCDRLVGRQHEIFDDARRIRRDFGHDVDRETLFIEDDLRLRKVKVDCSPLLPPSADLQ